jgi:hypothetical protein
MDTTEFTTEFTTANLNIKINNEGLLKHLQLHEQIQMKITVPLKQKRWYLFWKHDPQELIIEFLQ